MSDNNDDFNDVENGLPSENTSQKASIKLVATFTVVGVILAAIILWFDRSFDESVEFLPQEGSVALQVLMTGLFALFIGSLQAWIFKSKIKSRWYMFIIVSTIGGVVGGFVGGRLLNSGVTTAVIIGAINGFIAGGISSLIQNTLMRNLKHRLRWFLYNSISWAVIFSVAWKIGWDPSDFTNVAIAGAFLMIASGISLVVFLNMTPEIEFS